MNIEFDLPAHARAWGKAYPFLTVACPGDRPLFDATNEKVYEFLKNFLTEMTTNLFPDVYLHLGGDEVQYDCWQNNTQVNQWMKQHNIPTYKALQNYFETRVQKIAAELNRTVVFWEESFDNNFALLPSTIIDVWLDTDVLVQVVESGRQVIQSHGFYLDQQIPGPTTHYFFEDTWKDFYLNVRSFY
jgi:hexosaminidase